MSWLAYVDESMRQRRDGTGIYLFAAVIIESSFVDDLRLAALGLRRGKRPFHWRFEEASERQRAVQLLAGLEALHVITVGTGLVNSRQERGRRKCLEQLLWALQTEGVEQVWLDQRTPSLNKGDAALVEHLRTRGTLHAGFRVDFAQGFNGIDGEALMWFADAAAGAASAAHGDSDHRYLRQLSDRILREIHITIG